MTEQELAAERRARAQAEKQAKDALDRLSAFVVVQEQPGQMVLTLNGQVLFEFGESTLMPTARQRLQGVSDALKMMEGRKLTIVGHTDNVGDAQANKELSLERARSVRDYLVQQGLSEDMMTIEGRGETQPIAPNTTPAGRANNRRVEIVVGDGEGMQGTQGMQGTMGGQTGQQPKAKTGGPSEQSQQTKQGQQPRQKQKTKQQTPKQGQQQPGQRGQQGQERGTTGDGCGRRRAAGRPPPRDRLRARADRATPWAAAGTGAAMGEDRLPRPRGGLGRLRLRDERPARDGRAPRPPRRRSRDAPRRVRLGLQPLAGPRGRARSLAPVPGQQRPVPPPARTRALRRRSARPRAAHLPRSPDRRARRVVPPTRTPRPLRTPGSSGPSTWRTGAPRCASSG